MKYVWDLLDKMHNIHFYVYHCRFIMLIEYVFSQQKKISELSEGLSEAYMDSVENLLPFLLQPPLELIHTHFSFSWTQFLLVSKEIQHLTSNLIDPLIPEGKLVWKQIIEKDKDEYTKERYLWNLPLVGFEQVQLDIIEWPTVDR